MNKIVLVLMVLLLGCTPTTKEAVEVSGLPPKFSQAVNANHHFQASYNSAEISSEQLNRLAQASPFEVVAVYGEWCHDSHREIPRLVKLLQDAPNAQVSFHTVGYDKTLTVPVKGISSVEKTPTVFIFRDGKQIGVFVESSENGVVEDILQIVD